MDTNKFLEFNGKTIFFLAKNGVYWIAVKPICDALGVNFDRQYKNLKAHPSFRQLYAKQHMVGADGRSRNMVSLPERYIYGWLFQIRSESPDLISYQKQCCDILFDHFHGSITSRENLIREKTRHEIEVDNLMDKITMLPEYRQIQEKQALIKKIRAKLRGLDDSIHKDQLELFKSA